MYTVVAGCAIALLPDFNSSVFIMVIVNTTKLTGMITENYIVGLRTFFWMIAETQYGQGLQVFLPETLM